MVIALPIYGPAVEWLRSFFPIGFPWGYVGYAEYRNLELIQFAELTGVYGISALVVFFNAVRLRGVVRPARPQRSTGGALGTLTAMMIAAVVFGALRHSSFRERARHGKLRIAMVQGDIPQSVNGIQASSRPLRGLCQDETTAPQRVRS